MISIDNGITYYDISELVTLPEFTEGYKTVSGIAHYVNTMCALWMRRKTGPIFMIFAMKRGKWLTVWNTKKNALLVG